MERSLKISIAVLMTINITGTLFFELIFVGCSFLFFCLFFPVLLTIMFPFCRFVSDVLCLFLLFSIDAVVGSVLSPTLIFYVYQLGGTIDQYVRIDCCLFLFQTTGRVWPR